MTSLSGIKAISFDVDGTLWDFGSVMRRSLRRALLELEKADPDAAAMLDVDKMIAIRDRVHEELKDHVWDLEEVRREGFRRALKDVGRPDETLAAKLAGVYFESRYADTMLFDDVRPALEALAPKYVLGVVSNGNSYPKHLGLDSLMSFAVFSQDHGGIEKPDPQIFRIAATKAGCEPDQMVHVGDWLEVDVAGAQAAGLRAIWLNRDGLQRDTRFEPDWEIRSLREMADAL